jgi:hypothetical protein
MNVNCGKEWTRKFMNEHFTCVFMNKKYKPHLEQVLFDQEKSLLPSTQVVVEEIVRREKINAKIKKIDLHINHLKEQRFKLIRLKHNPAKIVKQFIRKCPFDECRGFLDAQWKCGLCLKQTCSDCHELKESEHTCNPDSVESAKLIAKDSRPCPKCQSLIYKIDGCDQMWCTQCHTAFSWTHGTIETKIHNPHYYEWQRKNGTIHRENNDGECGRTLDQYVFSQIYVLTKSIIYDIENHGGPLVKLLNKLQNIIRLCIHNAQVEIPQRHPIDNLPIRIDYLRGKIDESALKQKIRFNQKKSMQNAEIIKVIQFVNTAVTDVLYRLMDGLRSFELVKRTQPLQFTATSEIISCFNPFMDELEQISIYANEQLIEIGQIYKCQPFQFMDSVFRLVKQTKNQNKAINTDGL